MVKEGGLFRRGGIHEVPTTATRDRCAIPEARGGAQPFGRAGHANEHRVQASRDGIGALLISTCPLTEKRGERHYTSQRSGAKETHWHVGHLKGAEQKI